MIRIAIVGDIGCGKSHIAKQFGYPVFNADDEVSKIYKTSRTFYRKLKKSLPNHITSFPVKKNELLKAIMFDQKNLKKIVKIVHPAVHYKMNTFIKKHKNKKFIILDIPLLIENKINKKNDILIFVDAKKNIINKNLKKRPNYNNEMLKKLRKLQLPVEKKKKKCDFLVKNNFKNYSAKKNVKKILGKILLNA
jgi:dephospho-CoA kinase